MLRAQWSCLSINNTYSGGSKGEREMEGERRRQRRDGNKPLSPPLWFWQSSGSAGSSTCGRAGRTPASCWVARHALLLLSPSAPAPQSQISQEDQSTSSIFFLHLVQKLSLIWGWIHFKRHTKANALSPKALHSTAGFFLKYIFAQSSNNSIKLRGAFNSFPLKCVSCNTLLHRDILSALVKAFSRERFLPQQGSKQYQQALQQSPKWHLHLIST